MTLQEAITSRRSIRRYDPRPIEPEKLQLVAEAFRLAPSAGNGQNWKLLVVQSAELRAQIQQVCLRNPAFVGEAPAMLVACGLNQSIMTNGHRVDTTDVSIALSLSMMQAWELGLGTCWMASYDENDLRRVLSLPDSCSIVAITPLGYPAEEPAAKPRKAFEDVVEFL